MPDPTFSLNSTPSGQTSFVNRIRENFTHLLSMPRVALAAPHAVNAAPIHLLDERHGRTRLTGQAGSTLLHGVIFAILIYGVFRPIDKANLNSLQNSFPLRKLHYAPAMQTITAEISWLGKAGAGGEHNPLPPAAGELAHMSRIAFAPPRLPDDKLHVLSVPATVFDANAPELTPPVKDLGLPWMSDRNNSEGTGKAGIGSGPGSTMGDALGDGSGVGNSLLPYARVATQVVCRICPDPAYSDQARQAKVQGLVTMRVLVGADGRVKDVQLTRGIGLGLDENAVRAVRGWQFIPAKDAERHPVATWITIETVFRLF